MQDPGRHVKETIDEGEEAEKKNIDHDESHSKGHPLAKRGKVEKSLSELVKGSTVLIFDGSMQSYNQAEDAGTIQNLDITPMY